MSKHLQATLALLAITLGGCSVQSAGPANATPLTADAAGNTSAFVESHARFVRERETELRSPDGWPSLIGLHWLEEGTHTVGVGEGNAIRLAIGPARLGTVERRGEQVFFSAADTADVRVDGHAVQGEVAMLPEGRGGGTQLVYDGGQGRITAIGRGGQVALRVRHADSPARVHFSGLEFFPADPEWRLRARFVAHPAGKTLPIVNLIGNVSQTPNPGYVEFEKEGRQWRLEALGDPARSLNLMFQDQTSGRESYAVGRYLHTGPVAADGTLEVDFNRAYNPPCAYTAYATCPMPPPENRLAHRDADRSLVRLAVQAGEKKYVLAQR